MTTNRKNHVLIVFVLNIYKIICIWPTEFKVDLSHEEIFIISDPVNKSEFEDVYEEEEMINKEEMKELNVESHNDKYYRLHRNLDDDNNNMKDHGHNLQVRKNKVYEEFNPDKEYDEPFKADFVNSEGEFLNDDDVIYFNEEAKISPNKKRKRSESKNSSDENYDYAKLHAEFNEEIKVAIKSNETLNYTNVKEDENVKDSLKALVELKKPRNCTEEESNGLGLGAMECLWTDLNKPKLKHHVLERILRIVIIWICIYVLIAVPCWCQYGWCCCCCTCKFCKPHEQIEEVKQFFMQNPPGTFHDKDGNAIHYTPTVYEKYAQKKLEDQLRNL